MKVTNNRGARGGTSSVSSGCVRSACGRGRCGRVRMTQVLPDCVQQAVSKDQVVLNAFGRLSCPGFRGGSETRIRSSSKELQVHAQSQEVSRGADRAWCSFGA